MRAHAGREPIDAGPPLRLGPADIAAATFPVVRRNGLYPRPVYQYLQALAHEVAALHRALAAKDEEIQRHKDALVDWQSRLAPTRTAEGYLGRTCPAAPSWPTSDTPTDQWPAVQPPYGHPSHPEQP